jgi:arylsulfatase A-like enzyme
MSEEMQKKNVILITIDSLRRDSVGFLNPRSRLTPYLDKLASKSTVFSNAFGAGGGTLYAMSSLMTSCFPIINLGDTTIKGWPTLAGSFRQLGYRTAAFHSNAWLSQPFGFDQGFDEFHYIVPPLEHVVDLGSPARRIRQALNEFNSITIKNAPLWLRAFELFEQAGRWIKKHEENEDKKNNNKKPYFLWMHVMDVHFPYNYPTSALNRLKPGRILRYGFDFLARYSESNLIRTAGRNFSLMDEYNASIRYVDGILQNFCEKFPDSLIAIMSDHGDLFGEHGNFQHPGSLYNEIIRIPILIYDGGERRHNIINSNFSAVEMGDVLRSLSSEDRDDDDYYYMVQRPRINQMFSIHVDYNTKIRRTSIIDGSSKLMTAENLGGQQKTPTTTIKVELYDIERDPGELKDISQENQDLVNNLMALRANIMKKAERERLKLSMRRLMPALQKKKLSPTIKVHVSSSC